MTGLRSKFNSNSIHLKIELRTQFLKLFFPPVLPISLLSLNVHISLDKFFLTLRYHQISGLPSKCICCFLYIHCHSLQPSCLNYSSSFLSVHCLYPYLSTFYSPHSSQGDSVKMQVKITSQPTVKPKRFSSHLE